MGALGDMGFKPPIPIGVIALMVVMLPSFSSGGFWHANAGSKSAAETRLPQSPLSSTLIEVVAKFSAFMLQTASQMR
jgi:hypothetical protein